MTELRRGCFRALAILLGAVPFGFALIRAYVTRGGDVRYVWVALAASCGAAALIQIDKPSGSGRRAAAWLSASVFLSATVCAVVAAWLLGTRLGTGMLIVAAAFGLCFAAGSFFYLLARRLT